MKIFIGADHRGFKIKEELKKRLNSKGYEVFDEGNIRFDPEDDFPDFAIKVASKVAKSGGVGILLCGSGGMAMAANKIKGIRAVEVYDEERAEHAKTDDYANIITIPADKVDLEKAWKIVVVWLNAEEKTDEKYSRRIKKIEEIEREYFK